MRTWLRIPLAFLLTALLFAGCRQSIAPLDPELARFISAKQLQAHSLALSQGASLPSTADDLFAALLSNDWPTATNSFAKLDRLRNVQSPLPQWLQQARDWVVARLQAAGILKPPGPSWDGAPWEPIREAYWMYFLSRTWQKPHLEEILGDILATIGTNNIYFGGTDPGRFLVTATMASHELGRPCFVLTQNQLANGGYLDYLRSMLSNQIYVPTQTDAQQAFENYLVDAKQRKQAGKLRNGENVTIAPDGSVSVSGPGAVIGLMALVAKVVFEQNTNREIFLEQSFPLDWTYPHLLPVGPIFRINREPLAEIPEPILQASRNYWSNQCAKLIGPWISEQTSIGEVCDFIERVYVRGEMAGFAGDPQYLQDRAAQEYYSKLRYSTADLYRWRYRQGTDKAQNPRLVTESLLAFHQACALGPGNYEVVHDFCEVLAQIKRFDEAERLARASAMVNSTNLSILRCIEEIKTQSRKAP